MTVVPTDPDTTHPSERHTMTTTPLRITVWGENVHEQV